MIMAKKNKKQDTPIDPITSFMQDSGLLPVLKDNRVLLAGAAIATLISSEKGQEVLINATKSAKDWAAKSSGKTTGQKPKTEDAV
jgi:hypothetical protein